MKIGSRLPEYGLIGAAFILCQFAILYLYVSAINFFTTNTWFLGLQRFDTAVLQTLSPILTSTLSALAIISVFLVGLIISLFGAVWVIWEMDAFKKNLNQHRDWLEPLIESMHTVARNDLKSILTDFGGIVSSSHSASNHEKIPKERLSDTPSFISQYYRLRESLSDIFGFIPAYYRLLALFVSLITFAHEKQQLDVMFDEMRLWRTVRSLSTALSIVAIELIVLAAIVLLQMLLDDVGDWIPSICYMGISILAVLIYWLFKFMNLKTYSIFATTLFAHLYVCTRIYPQDRG